MTDDLPIDKVLELMNKPQQQNRMPFGKHAGKKLEDVPKSYLSWLRDNGAFDKQENHELRDRLQELGRLKV